MARLLPRPLGLIVLGALAGASPASAADPPPGTDSQLRALSGSDAARAADPSALRGLSRPEDRNPAARTSATPLLQPDSTDAAGISRALAAGDRTSRQLVTPEEDDAGSVGGALLAIAGLVLAVVLLTRFVGNSHSG
ncbi:MAG: hypothetical protein JWO51_2042 [Rhodospirillales bacterium]|nr:hypothetical protein [Rhodospirillales bacterium]